MLKFRSAYTKEPTLINLLELWQLWLKREKIAITRLFYNTKIMTRINALAAQIIGQAIVYTMPDFR